MRPPVHLLRVEAQQVEHRLGEERSVEQAYQLADLVGAPQVEHRLGEERSAEQACQLAVRVEQLQVARRSASLSSWVARHWEAARRAERVQPRDPLAAPDGPR